LGTSFGQVWSESDEVRCTGAYCGLMGDWAQNIVDVDVTGDEATELGERLTAWLVDTGVIASELTDCVLGSPAGHPPGAHYAHAIGAATDPPNLWSNGVEIGVGRTVYYTMDLQGVTCPRCGRFEELESEAGPLALDVRSRTNRLVLAYQCR
jgi:hypothetical protein